MENRGSVLWVIGGTGEAVELASALTAEQIPCLVTVTTAIAQHAYKKSTYLKVLVGGLNGAALGEFIHAQRIGAVLDVSHPFAVEISKGAIAAARALNLPYWRYERPAIESSSSGRIHYIEDLQTVLTPEVLLDNRTLLTLGYRWLHRFAPWQAQATLFARILPSPVALDAALGAGFTPDRLIALRPPITTELECALWQQWGITQVITKASGAPGGENIKRAAAEQLNISLFILNRPQLNYPVVCRSSEEALAFCRGWWRSRPSHE
ncbi:cobalt-precorrin-6A reductase [Phormidium tenue]|uniref:Precorrin-6x reductase n=1 Tax=Phormidium tenue NIES-30 TaxID=549789 RepID=A0A1U7J7H4_9CYAN|nr:cobalt-precorrin-6A reductase [Phormidium tenue]MBD2231524.1 cobalt-precorrin-6A reductase [Phormidium tenue FACHB-1052]OKH49088.1 precorrin-6x reductase [Phormidium tenue NIES-30]